MKNIKLISIRVVKTVDCDPDTSYYGEYSNIESGPYTIDREERGDRNRGEYRYFNCGHNYAEMLNNPSERAEAIRYCEQDYKRMEDYNSQQWQYIGIHAEAKIEVNGIIQTIKSGGLWGIESDSAENYFDSEENYFDSVGKEEIAVLGEQLKALGVSTRKLNQAKKTVEIVND